MAIMCEWSAIQQMAIMCEWSVIQQMAIMCEWSAIQQMAIMFDIFLNCLEKNWRNSIDKNDEKGRMTELYFRIKIRGVN